LYTNRFMALLTPFATKIPAIAATKQIEEILFTRLFPSTILRQNNTLAWDFYRIRRVLVVKSP
jgi:hypothetical protein